jgi:hypothetical protein
MAARGNSLLVIVVAEAPDLFTLKCGRAASRQLNKWAKRIEPIEEALPTLPQSE